MEEDSIEDRVSTLEDRLDSLESRSLAWGKLDIWAIVAVFCALGIAILYTMYM